MVKKQVVQLHDDLDGTEAHETVQFSLDGKHYEIDLKTEHATMLRDSLGRFIGAARVIGPVRGGRGGRGGQHRHGRTATNDRARLNAIRDWARDNGYTVADRGRIPTHIEAAYDAKH